MSLSRKKHLSSEAKIFRELQKKQPQKKDELCKNASIDESTFYRKLPVLIEAKIIKETNDGFALSTYVEVQKEIEDYVDKSMVSLPITLNEIASAIGVSLLEIKKVIYPIMKKRGLIIRVEKGEEVIDKKHIGILKG